MADRPVLICGAGVVGLILAHGLKNANIPFQVYERDAHIDARPHGWAITIHWALPFLRQLLDAETLAAVDSVQVDPEFARHDNGNFSFLNLATLEPKFRIPPNERRRVNREGLRKVLLRPIADRVHWAKRLADVQPLDDGEGVRAVFEDGSEAEGMLLVGADGANSSTRRYLLPDAYLNSPVPVCQVGAAVDVPPETMEPVRKIDPLLFQGCHPVTDDFLWVSLLETPATNGSAGRPDEHYRVQVMLSWLIDEASRDEVPRTDAAPVVEMKRRANDFHPLLRTVIHLIPDAASVMEVSLQDWEGRPWDNRGGRVTLIGDAAHTMTMYRGEAANHAIVDAAHLIAKLQEFLRGTCTRQAAVDEFEAEVRERTRPAVQLSRRACIEAHDLNGLNENSAVLKKRAIKLQ